MSTTIIIQDLSKTFPPVGAAPPSTAVDAVTLTIPHGELFFLLGPSGCGKTTLLRMIAGFIEPDKGRVLFDVDGQRQDVTYVPAEHRGTGMVFQSYALWPHMTVAQNVAFGLEVRKVKRAQREQLVKEALAQVRMQDYAQRKPNQLSGGQQQRIALARAIVIKPRVLLLDEPLSNLDAKLRIELRGEIRRVCKQSGITTVYVTHDQKEALSMADRVAILRAGRVVQIGSPSELYRRPSNRFVADFLGETNILPGKIAAVTDDFLTVATGAGNLLSASGASAMSRPTSGDSVLVSIRHEALHRSLPGMANSFEAGLEDSVYLGELSQQTLRAKGGERLVMATLNPAASPTANANSDPIGAAPAAPRVTVQVAPEDVVLLPPDS